jgi:hypothetical protein
MRQPRYRGAVVFLPAPLGPNPNLALDDHGLAAGLVSLLLDHHDLIAVAVVGATVPMAMVMTIVGAIDADTEPRIADADRDALRRSRHAECENGGGGDECKLGDVDAIAGENSAGPAAFRLVWMTASRRLASA